MVKGRNPTKATQLQTGLDTLHEGKPLTIRDLVLGAQVTFQ